MAGRLEDGYPLAGGSVVQGISEGGGERLSLFLARVAKQIRTPVLGTRQPGADWIRGSSLTRSGAARWTLRFSAGGGRGAEDMAAVYRAFRP